MLTTGRRPLRIFRRAAAALFGLGLGLGFSPSVQAGKVDHSRLTLRFATIERVSGEDPQLPLEFLTRYRGETVVATYQVCVRSDGSVWSVKRRSGIEDADSFIVSTVRTWRYRAQPPNTMTCLHEVFEFSP